MYNTYTLIYYYVEDFFFIFGERKKREVIGKIIVCL